MSRGADSELSGPPLAARFHELHAGPRVLVLPNAWDAMSARVFSVAGFPALATSSASVAWALGRPDGEKLTRDEMVAAVARIVAASDLPVTADIETGFGATPEDVGETVRRIVAVGAVGVNIEDGTPNGPAPLMTSADHAARLRAARRAADGEGVNLFINGRTDVYLLGVGEPGGRFDHAVERAQAMLEAGADGVFVPGLKDLETISRLVASIPAPVNVLVVEGSPPVAELERVGLRRLSTGGRPAQAVLGLLSKIAAELRDQGTYDLIFEHAMPYPEIQNLFAARPVD